MQAPPIFYLRRLIRHLHGREKRATLFLAIVSIPFQLLQQPSAEVACNLCRGAQAVTAIYRRKGRFGGIISISGGISATSIKQRKRAKFLLAIVSPPYQLLQQPSAEVACNLCRGAQAVTAIYRRKGRVWVDCKYKWRNLRHLHQTTEARQIARFYRCFGGGGGSRTRVQTGSPRAFYTFSYRLVLLRASGRQQPNTRPSF